MLNNMNQIIQPEERKCSMCGVVLIVGNTITEKSHKNGNKICRICSNKKSQDYKNKQNELADTDPKAQWWRIGRLLSSRLSKFKKENKKVGLDIYCDTFEVIMAHLREKYPVLPKICPAMEIELRYKTISNSKFQCPNSVSIDRINSDKGYVVDNIQILSLKANTIKSDSNCEEVFKIYNFTCKTQKQNMKEVLKKHGFVFFQKNNSKKIEKNKQILEKQGGIPTGISNDICQFEFKF